MRQNQIRECRKNVVGYSFPCVSGLCPCNRDFESKCYPELDKEQRALFEELFKLRSELAKSVKL